jgi:hypothetical protein
MDLLVTAGRMCARLGGILGWEQELGGSLDWEQGLGGERMEDLTSQACERLFLLSTSMDSSFVVESNEAARKLESLMREGDGAARGSAQFHARNFSKRWQLFLIFL